MKKRAWEEKQKGTTEKELMSGRKNGIFDCVVVCCFCLCWLL